MSDSPLIRRPGVDPLTALFKPPHPGVDHAVRVEDALRIETNIKVAMRDGVEILVDLYLPADLADGARLPALLGWSPYGKHNLSDSLWPAAGVEPGWMSRHTAFEAPDPARWCPAGYAVITPDPRGMWYSDGDMHHGGAQESADIYDLIEWIGTRDWCNGKVGMSGVSYLAAAQYQVAALQPPHLTAINPWEAFSDWYREFGYHGGMRDTGFVPMATQGLRYSTTTTEDTAANMIAHPLIDGYWESKAVDLSAITCPAFFVASWSDQGLHLRGTLEAYKAARSPQKYLLIHGQKKWAHYYDPSNVALAQAYFDATLRGEGDLRDWPRVRIEIRERAGVGHWRDEAEWPLARTCYTPLYLDARDGSLNASPRTESAKVIYDPDYAEDGALFDLRFKADTELTGHMALRLWVEPESGDDMDLFVAVQKLDVDGAVVPFTFYAVSDAGPVALGWLRASHRALDEDRSTPWQPVHLHRREDPLTPGTPVAVDIEIWPSSTLFRAGESLRLLVRGQDIYTQIPQPGPAMMQHQDTRNRGRHIIHTGGAHDSYLLVPVIPTSDTGASA
jgi:predicted acyl esterase